QFVDVGDPPAVRRLEEADRLAQPGLTLGAARRRHVGVERPYRGVRLVAAHRDPLDRIPRRETRILPEEPLPARHVLLHHAGHQEAAGSAAPRPPPLRPAVRRARRVSRACTPSRRTAIRPVPVMSPRGPPPDVSRGRAPPASRGRSPAAPRAAAPRLRVVPWHTALPRSGTRSWRAPDRRPVPRARRFGAPSPPRAAT